MKENKATERSGMEEQLCDFFFFFGLFLKCGHISFLFLFFLKLAIFSTSLLQEEKSNRFFKGANTCRASSSNPLKRPA